MNIDLNSSQTTMKQLDIKFVSLTEKFGAIPSSSYLKPVPYIGQIEEVVKDGFFTKCM